MGIVALVFSHVGDVYVIQGSEVVKVEDMVLGDVRAVNEIADDASVIGNLVGDTESAVEVERGGNAVRLRADAADSLGDYLGVARVSAPQDKLQAAEKVTGGPGVFNHAVFHDAFYL